MSAPRADTGVEQDRHSVADLGGVRWLAADRRRRGFELTAAMVRDPDGVRADVDRASRIGWIKDALDDDVARPPRPDLGDIVEAQRTAEAGAHEAGHCRERCPVEVLLDGAKARNPVTQHRHRQVCYLILLILYLGQNI